MKDKKAIKKDILDKFRAIKEGSEYIIPKNWLQYQYVDNLTASEKKLFDQAVKELVRKGLVEPVDGLPYQLKLTEKGINLIH